VSAFLNVQHPTPNTQRPIVEPFLGSWALGVGRWMLKIKSAVFLLRQGYGGHGSLPPSLKLRRTCQSTVSPRAAFTLLELMTVMVIMFILMGISTLALRGLMRGAGISGAVSNVRSMLTQARQQAIMNQQATAVVFKQSGGTNTMQILTSYGRVANRGANVFTAETELPWTPGEMTGVVVYNFRGGSGTFTGAGSGETYGTSGITWQVGDDIAFQVGDIRPLPDGIVFDNLPNPPVVVFNPDGSAVAGLDIDLRERNTPTTNEVFTILVNQQTGWIEVEEP